MNLKTTLFALIGILSLSTPALAADANDPIVPVLYGLFLIFLFAKLCGYLATKIHQPAVLGELLAGIVLGNIYLLGFDGFEFLKTNEAFEIIAGIGVILLLFEVGLDSSLSELLKVGVSSFLVAIVGVIAPFGLGWFLSEFLLPDASEYVHAFVGATLCATSVGITARVLKDLGKLKSQEAKVILGAAVIDDVLGLIILAVVVGMISAAATAGGGGFNPMIIATISIKSIGFLLVAVLFGLHIAPHIFKMGARIRLEGMMQATALAVCFMFAFASAKAGLAPIVGAFAAGLVIDTVGFGKYFSFEEKSLEELLLPVSNFFVPVFFVTMGLKVELINFSDPNVLLLAGGLTAAAIIGKQACAFAALGKGINRMAIGIGMIPRGEVGLIFAGIGSKLVLDGQPVIDSTLFSAIVVMVALTTVMTPPLLTWSMRKNFDFPKPNA